MGTTTDAVTAGSSQNALSGAATSDESSRIREYFDLRDALIESGCPICARVLHAGREVLAALLTEPASAPPAQKSVLAFRGLCNTHAWAIHQLPNRPVSLADAYEAFLRGRIEALGRALAHQRGTSPRWWSAWLGPWRRREMTSLPPRRRIRRCPACRSAQAVEQRDLGLLLDLITDMEFVRAFESSTGLCLPHVNLILRLAPNHPNLPRLLEAHTLKVKRLHAELQDFLRRARAPLVTLTQEEQVAIWSRVLEWTVGKAGVFGHERDLASEADASSTRRPWGCRAVGRRVPRQAGGEGEASRMDEVERLALENAKLQRRLLEVSREWAEESARRAALQFQVHKLSEDVKVLELNLAGARGEAKAGDVQAARLREEIQALRGEIQRLSARQGAPPDTIHRGDDG